ncbi:MAG: hypothetical protein QXR48_02910 [Candidatus Woesearchaeota archaeon]
MHEETSRRSLVGTVISCLQDIKRLLLKRRSANPEAILSYIETIESFTPEGFRRNPDELARVSELLDTLEAKTKDEDVLDRIRSLRELLRITAREFEYRAS